MGVQESKRATYMCHIHGRPIDLNSFFPFLQAKSKLLCIHSQLTSFDGT